MFRKLVKPKKKPLSKPQKYQVAKIARNMLETKYTQTSTGIQAVYANATNNTGVYWQDITATVSQNPGDFANRIGDKISITQMKMNYTIFCPSPIVDNPVAPSNCVRVMIIQYLRNDNAPASSELFRTNSTLGGPYLSSYSFRNRDYKKFYHVLYDKRHCVNTNRVYTTAIPTKYRVDVAVKIPIRKMQKVIQYTGGSTTSDNGIWFFAIGDQAHNAIQDPNVAANFEILYKDA